VTRCTGTLRLVIACNERAGTCRYMRTMRRKQGLGALEGTSPYLLVHCWLAAKVSSASSGVIWVI
jgi:hypothetical protein